MSVFSGEFDDSGGGWTPFDVGTYRARIHEVEMTKSRNENPMAVLKMDIISDDMETAHRHTEYLVLTKKTLWKADIIFNACGADYERAKDEDTGKVKVKFDPNDLEGHYCFVKIQHETYEKKDGSEGISYKIAEWTPGAQAQPGDPTSPWIEQTQTDNVTEF